MRLMQLYTSGASKIQCFMACGCVIGALCFFASCDLSMSYRKQVENIMEAPHVETQVACKTPFFVPGAWPDKNWWEAFGSSDLNGLIQRALLQNPSIDAIYAQLRAVGQETIIARSTLFPFVYFNTNDIWQYMSENGLYRALNPTLPLNNQQIDFSLSFTYEFDFWSKYRNIYEASLGRARAAYAEVAQVELITTTALAQAFFALQTNKMRRELYLRLYEIRHDYYKLQCALLENSVISRLQPLLSEEWVLEAKRWIDQVDEEIAVARHLVNVLAGSGPDEPLLLDAPLHRPAQQLALPTTISLELLSRRPDLMAQIWQVEALAHDVGVAKAEFWPDINLVGLAGFQTGSWTSLFSWASKAIGLTPGLSLPIYTSGAIGANVGVKKALFDEAVYTYNALILQSVQEVSDLLAIGHSVYDQKRQQEGVVASALMRYQLTALRQANGLDDALAVYRSLEALIQKELEDVELLYGQYLVSIRLTKALGGGYFSCAPLSAEECAS